jgi:hypothetical protein
MLGKLGVGELSVKQVTSTGLSSGYKQLVAALNS